MELHVCLCALREAISSRPRTATPLNCTGPLISITQSIYRADFASALPIQPLSHSVPCSAAFAPEGPRPRGVGGRQPGSPASGRRGEDGDIVGGLMDA